MEIVPRHWPRLVDSRANLVKEIVAIQTPFSGEQIVQELTKYLSDATYINRLKYRRYAVRECGITRSRENRCMCARDTCGIGLDLRSANARFIGHARFVNSGRMNNRSAAGRRKQYLRDSTRCGRSTWKRERRTEHLCRRLNV